LFPKFLEVGHSLSHSLCENKNKKVMVNTECNHLLAGSDGASAGSVGRNAHAGDPASRSFLMRKKAEQPWEYARKGGTLGGTESFLFRLFTAFYGFLRLMEKNFAQTAKLEAHGKNLPDPGRNPLFLCVGGVLLLKSSLADEHLRRTGMARPGG